MSNTQDFYTGSLRHELHLVSQGNSSLTLHYFKRLTKFTTLLLQNMQEHHIVNLKSYKNQTSIAKHLL